MEDSNVQENCENTVVETRKRKLCSNVLQIFPDACPEYVHHITQQLEIDDIISEMLETNYPKRIKVDEPEKLGRDAQYQLILELLPDADPDYLQMKVDELIDNPGELNLFVIEATRTGEYPTREEHLKKQMLSAQQKQYTTDFNVERFLEVIVDPVEYFKQHNRLTLNNITMHYAICFLRNYYRFTPLATIRSVMISTQSITQACSILNNPDCVRIKSKRALVDLPSTVESIPLLQQIAYIRHYDEIMNTVRKREESRQKEKEIARNQGILKTCLCCYDDEVMPVDIFTCENYHEFCKSCIQKSVEISFAEGKLQYLCCSCNSYFNLFTLKSVLPPKLFSQISSKLQLQEIVEAGIENLEHCPYCNFAAIPHEDDKVFKCFNENCMKETCRLCKKPSHLPLKCNEVEEHETKTRTFIEDKLTESLIRKCWKCQKPYVKSDGCNQVTCPCGAKNCYVCRQPVSDYNHFNGLGGDKYHLCPLFSNTEEEHFNNVISGVNEVRRNINDASSHKILNSFKHDLDEYYEIGKKK